MFGPPGCAYVYLNYGIHHLLNVVVEAEGKAAAVLIRALEPLEGSELMRRRRGCRRAEDLCSGPGKLAQALGVTLAHNGLDITKGSLLIRPGCVTSRQAVLQSPRIGISEGTDLPWRFSMEGSRFVSRGDPNRASAVQKPEGED